MKVKKGEGKNVKYRSVICNSPKCKQIKKVKCSHLRYFHLMFLSDITATACVHVAAVLHPQLWYFCVCVCGGWGGGWGGGGCICVCSPGCGIRNKLFLFSQKAQHFVQVCVQTPPRRKMFLLQVNGFYTLNGNSKTWKLTQGKNKLFSWGSASFNKRCFLFLTVLLPQCTLL